MSQKQQRALFISETSLTSLFPGNSSHLFSLFIPQPDAEPAMIRFQRVLAQALGAGAVPGRAVWLWLPCPFAGHFLGVPAVAPRAALSWWTPTLPFSSLPSPPLPGLCFLRPALNSPFPAPRKGRFHILCLWRLLWQRSIYLRIIMVPRDVAVAMATITHCVEYQSKCHKEQEPLVVFINLMFLFWTKCDS